VTAKVDAYYGVVIRRLAAHDQLPPGFSAPIPPSPRLVVTIAGTGSGGATGPLAAPAQAEPIGRPAE
jgi:hypothetical protein